jgi:large subunit ribosomal protein L13
MIYDAKNQIFGRAASQIAKKLLNGEEVIIINAEEFGITGNPNYIVEKFKQRRSWRNKANPEHSPKYPRVPHLLVKRMIRGMLPIYKKTGRIAFRKLKVFTGNPNNLVGEQFDNAKLDLNKPHIKIKDLCIKLGWNNG